MYQSSIVSSAALAKLNASPPTCVYGAWVALTRVTCNRWSSVFVSYSVDETVQHVQAACHHLQTNTNTNRNYTTVSLPTCIRFLMKGSLTSDAEPEAFRTWVGLQDFFLISSEFSMNWIDTRVGSGWVESPLLFISVARVKLLKTLFHLKFTP